ncbi:MAG: hypothetical protein DHS20C15_11710 [Planctomycetota bacterium]|nr:MAG: hypothetical protein DHS20C15_11710 [Planctomycetota bacterium]
MSALLLEVAVALTPWLLGVVLLALGAMTAWVAVLAGGFVREALQRRAQVAVLVEAERLVAAQLAARAASVEPLDHCVARALERAPDGLGTRFAEALAAQGVDNADAILQALDARAQRVLLTHTLLTRLAPMGGLVATLLPLGPALSQLSEGDLPALAADLTVAFTATVAGLAVSCAAFAMGSLRRRWYDDDLARLELLLLRLVPDEPSA